MNQVQLFSNSSMTGLQEEINSWLSENRDIEVRQTNIDSINRSNLLGNLEQPDLYLFYILYYRGQGKEAMEERVLEEEFPQQNTIAGISSPAANDPGMQALAFDKKPVAGHERKPADDENKPL